MKIGSLVGFLQEHPLVGPVRDHLARRLARDGEIHTVSLYRAQTQTGVFADVLINNQPDDMAGIMLKAMEWPDDLMDSEFLGVRHFLLCVADKATQA
jgi:hypothetical protein